MLYMGATDVKHRGNYVKKIGAKAVRANEVLPNSGHLKWGGYSRDRLKMGGGYASGDLAYPPLGVFDSFPKMVESRMADSKMAKSKMTKSKMSRPNLAESKIAESKMAKSEMVNQDGRIQMEPFFSEQHFFFWVFFCVRIFLWTEFTFGTKYIFGQKLKNNFFSHDKQFSSTKNYFYSMRVVGHI